MIRRHASDEHGFTLIELMVVVVVIGILVAIAIPTMQTARGRAMDRDAQARVRTGFLAEKVHFLNQAAASPSYTADTAVLSALESAVPFDTGAPAGTDDVYVSMSGATVYLAAKSESGRCWYLRQDPAIGTVDFYGGASCVAPDDSLPWRARW